VDRVVLSHGHYDHTGGLLPLLRGCGGKEVLAHPEVFARRYRVKDTGESISIGIPYTEEILRGAGARFDFAEGFREIAPGIYLTGEVPRRNLFETGDSGLFCDDAGCRPDPLRDDQSLIIVTVRGLVLVLGCCHGGIVNTIAHARERTGVGDVYAVLGGTHLGFSAPRQLEQTMASLREYGVGKIIGSHCTGFAASARLLREFPGGFQPGHVGYTLEV
jgi:7,8-dihydropterin-6-yl-methyl-4-(beta-D-ribofuranosyl)aminobenzene 5'-phosphate synthase